MSPHARTPRFGAITAALLLTAAPSNADFIAVCWSGEIVVIDEVTGTAQLLGVSSTPELDALARLEPWGLVTYTNQPSAPPRLMRVDPILAQTTFLASPFLNDVRSLGVDSQSKLYAIDTLGSGTENRLYWLDLTAPPMDTSIKHFVGLMPLAAVQGMTSAPNGQLYAWSVVHGLIVVDPATANATDVNGTMDGTGAIQTLAWSSGSLYGAGDRLYRIDTTTGLPTAIGPLLTCPVYGMEPWDTRVPTRYCTPKPNSLGCASFIDSSGTPSLSGPDDFHVFVASVPSHRAGVLLWSLTAANTPFQGGTLCLGAPIERTTLQDSGGTSGVYDCSGSYTFHFSTTFAQAHGLLAGTQVHVQYYYRDPGQSDGTAVGLTDALRFMILP